MQSMLLQPKHIKPDEKWNTTLNRGRGDWRLLKFKGFVASVPRLLKLFVGQDPRSCLDFPLLFILCHWRTRSPIQTSFAFHDLLLSRKADKQNKMQHPWQQNIPNTEIRQTTQKRIYIAWTKYHEFKIQ
jgi:hypothetical protein